jgi:Protein of unknown function (DUF664)
VKDERDAVTAFLQAQRRSVLAIVDGLDERDLRRSVVPSGWTVRGMVEHLTGAEGYWFSEVLAGGVADEPGPDAVAAYRRQALRSDEALAAAPLDSGPVGEVPPHLADEVHTARDVALHMIEETARHAGHLDIARELLDGRTGLGPR